MIYGIDISEWNGDLDIAALKPAFVIIRAGYGKNTYDIRLEDNIRKCIAADIPYGLYWYSYALTPEAAKLEARKANMLFTKYNPKFGMWFDMEDGDGYKRRNGFKFNKENITAICAAFLDAIETDLKGVYVSESWLKYIEEIQYPVWVASWGINDGSVPDKDFSNYYMWQFTSHLNGMALDGNIYYGQLLRPQDLLYMAIDTINGEYGNGEARKRNLGIHYNIIQELINKAYEGSNSK